MTNPLPKDREVSSASGLDFSAFSAWPAGIVADRLDTSFAARARLEFQRWGVILAVFLPVLHHIGRALGEIFSVVYLCWALLCLRVDDFRAVPGIAIAYCAVLITFAIGLWQAVEVGPAIKLYLEFGFSLLPVFCIIGYGRQLSRDRYLATWFCLACFIAYAVFLARLGWYAMQSDFDPGHQVNAMAVAALLPLVGAFCFGPGGRHGKLWFPVVVVATLLPLLFVDSRTEVFMVVAGVLVFYGFHYRRIAYSLIISIICIPIVVIVDFFVTGARFYIKSGWFVALDRLSSSRLSIWQVPFSHPPGNVWTGVGIGQDSYYLAQLMLDAKNMHNFLLELWYETGWLGFASLLLFLALLVRKVPKAYAVLPVAERPLFAAVVGSCVAVFAAALLDKGYTAPLFRLYFVFCLGMLCAWSHSLNEDAG